MLMKRLIPSLSTAGLLLAMAGALNPGWAQAGTWVWLDDSGRKIYSDQPPPSAVPDKRILQQPGRPKSGSTAVGETLAPPAPASPPSAPSPAAPASKGKTGTPATDPAALKKQQAAEAERKAQEEKSAQIRAENCRRAQSSLRTVQSGVRMVATDDQGNQVVFDDKLRAAEAERLQAAIEANCN
ncbi:MAG TPA: DUF4124 domain-containing protein [Macromonas sp.]|nr:DUF4124 domain-containing protein [Macromonas sp.]